MTKPRNLYLYGSLEELKRLKEEYDILGRPSKIEGDRLIVFALAPKKPKKKDARDNKGRSSRTTRD